MRTGSRAPFAATDPPAPRRGKSGGDGSLTAGGTLLAFCHARRIPTPATNAHVLGHEVDCLWPAAKLIAELDSWEFHGHRSAFERDRARDPKFLLAGYRTIRVTHRRLDREADQLAEEIEGLLRLGSIGA